MSGYIDLEPLALRAENERLRTEVEELRRQLDEVWKEYDAYKAARRARVL